MPGPHSFFRRITLGLVQFITGSGSPQGLVSGVLGSLFPRDDVPLLYQSLGGTNWNPIAATTPYLVGTDPDQPYTGIQAAIDAALADGHDETNPATVLVRSGTYVGDITLRRGIHLVAMSPMPESTKIIGTVTCALTDGGGGASENQTSMQGFQVLPVIGDAFVFSGTTPQELFLSLVNLRAGVGGVALRCTNTGVDSIITWETARLQAPVGTAGGMLVGGTAGVNMTSFSINCDDPAIPAIRTIDSGRVQMSNGILAGFMSIEGIGAISQTSLVFQIVLGATPCATILGGAQLNMGPSHTVAGGVSPNVVGPGILGLAGAVTFLSSPGLDPALSLFRPPSERSTTTYNPSGPAIGAWGGPGVPATHEDAIDRMAIFISGIHGAIP